MKTCRMCRHCNPMNICGSDCECKAKSDNEIIFEVSEDDDICFYGEQNNEPCQYYEEM